MMRRFVRAIVPMAGNDSSISFSVSSGDDRFTRRFGNRLREGRGVTGFSTLSSQGVDEFMICLHLWRGELGLAGLSQYSSKHRCNPFSEDTYALVLQIRDDRGAIG